MQADNLVSQACRDHSHLPNNSQISVINLAKDSKLPALACPYCLDEEDYKLKEVYVSINRFLEIQKTYKEINGTDIQKQLDELNFVQKKINHLFESAKNKIVKESHDKQLAKKYKIDMPKYETMEAQYKNQIINLNNPYLDIQKLLKLKNPQDHIDADVRAKYFSQNNGIKELQKISKVINYCFSSRVDQNKSIDSQLSLFKQRRIFVIGVLSKLQHKFIQKYSRIYQASSSENRIGYKTYQLFDYNPQQYTKTFLKRYINQACLYAKNIIFLNPKNFTQQLKLCQKQEQELKKRAWKRLQEVSIVNNVSEENLSSIFTILKSDSITILKIYQFNKNENVKQQKIVQKQIQTQIRQLQEQAQIHYSINNILSKQQTKAQYVKQKKEKRQSDPESLHDLQQQIKMVKVTKKQQNKKDKKKKKNQNQKQKLPIKDLSSQRYIQTSLTFKFLENIKLSSLKQLVISHIQLKQLVFQAIIQSCFKTLSILSLEKNNLQVNSFGFFGQKLKDMPNLTELNIVKNQFSIKQCSDLFADKNAWINLHKIDLTNNKLNDQLIKTICECKFNNLRNLVLIKNVLKKPQGLLSAQLPQLNQLQIQDNQIQTAFALKLASKNWDKKNIRINLNQNCIDSELFNAKFSKMNKKNMSILIDYQKQYQQNFQKYFQQQKKQMSEGENKQIQFKINNEALAKSFIKDTKQLFNKMDVFYEQNPVMTARICESLLSQKPTQQQKQQSSDIQKQLKKKAEQQQDPLSIILLGFKDAFTDDQNKDGLIFTKNSSIKTQLSAKILSTQFMQQQVKFQEKLQENQKWNFNDLQTSEKKTQEFKQWYIEKLAAQYGIQKQSIVIHKIIKGSIKVQWSTTNPTAVVQANVTNPKLKVHRYFAHFALSPDDFDPKGNHEYGDQKCIQWRGGWPYFMPVKCKRYGLAVSNRYDNGNDRWLEMQGKEGQWAVAYHGVNCPNNPCNNGTVMSSIMSGKDQGQMLIAGGGQAYWNSKSLNFPNENVGRGIYCSPHIQVSLLSYSGGGVNIGGKNYHLVFQCRVNPKKIKVCSNHDYWVINDSKDIRPYGVLLTKSQQKASYPTVDQLYGNQKFNWDTYKGQIKLANA